jgi:hypothetical protein
MSKSQKQHASLIKEPDIDVLLSLASVRESQEGEILKNFEKWNDDDDDDLDGQLFQSLHDVNIRT